MPPIGSTPGSIENLQQSSLDQSVDSGSSIDSGSLGPHSVTETEATSHLSQLETSDLETKPLDEFRTTKTPKEESEKLSRSFAKGGQLLKDGLKELAGAAKGKLGRGAKAVGNKFSGLAAKVKNGAATVRKVKLPRPHLPSRPKGFKLPGKSILSRSAVKTQAKLSVNTLKSNKVTQQQTITDKKEALTTSQSQKDVFKAELEILKNPEPFIAEPLESLGEGEAITLELPDGSSIQIYGEANSEERIDSVLNAQDQIYLQKQAIKEELASTRQEIKTTNKALKTAKKEQSITDKALTKKALKREKLLQQADTRTRKQELGQLKDALSTASKEKKSAKKMAKKEATSKKETRKKGRAQAKKTLNKALKTHKQSKTFRSKQQDKLERDIAKLQKKLTKNPEQKEDIEVLLQAKQQTLTKIQEQDEGSSLKATELEEELTSRIDTYDQDLIDTENTSEVQEAREKKAKLKTVLEAQQQNLRNQKKENRQALKNIKSQRDEKGE